MLSCKNGTVTFFIYQFPTQILILSRVSCAGLAFSMLGYIENYRMKTVDPDKTFDTLGHKIVTAFTKNRDLKNPLPVIIGTVFLFDTCTGQLKTIVEGNNVTAWRTAGSCMVGTKYLYFDRNEQHKGDKVLSILGCGVQVITKPTIQNRTKNSFSFSIREEFMQLVSVLCFR